MYLPGNNRSIPLVFELGSHTTRFGFGGEMSPFIIQQSVKY
jgi:hypothetical protein